MVGFALAWLTLGAASIAPAAVISTTQQDRPVPLTALAPRLVRQGWGPLNTDKSVQGKPLMIGGRAFARGIGTHASSHLLYLLGGRYKRFRAWAGLDDEIKDYPRASASFQVVADGKVLFDSGTMHAMDPARRVDLDTTGVQILRLIVSDGGDGNYADHADWAEPELTPLRYTRAPRTAPRERLYSLRSKGMTYDLRGGSLVGVRLPNGKRLSLAGSGGIESGFLGVKQRQVARFVVLQQGFRLAQGGLQWRWSMKVQSTKPWTAPVDTVFHYPNAKDVEVWLPWGHTWKWEDPMLPRPFETRTWEYGAFFNRENGLSLPMATVIDKKNGIGVTFIQSPEDVLLDVQISTTKEGEIRFSRAFNRFGGNPSPGSLRSPAPSTSSGQASPSRARGNRVAFHMDVVFHEPDVRAALKAIVERYPKFFDPPNKLADEVGGLGAYSGYEGPLETAKLRAMGYSMNWKASLDFPYMGLFLPPLGPDTRWNRFAGGGGGSYTAADEGRFGNTSIRQMAEYSKRMRADGFHVLNYFNVTEFGGNIEIPWKGTEGQRDEGLWKDPNAFLHTKLEKAILKNPDPIWTWGGAVIMDCGDPAYREFLLNQARRQLKELPESSGICIDRMDWLTQYNPHADDGVTWIEGPQRHLRRSWIALMNKMGPIIHKAGKVIFVNDMDRRLELMRHVDGFYDEHGDFPFNLNTSAFLALRKPLVVWTRGNETLKPDPDAYFQRNLYLGAFPTAPLSANDHTIVPDAWNENLYLDYGPMFRAIKGRKWVLEPGIAYVEGGKAKVNVFDTPKGRVVFVGLGGKAKSVRVTVRGLPTKGELLHPGADDRTRVVGEIRKGRATFEVPLVRGCALLLLGSTH